MANNIFPETMLNVFLTILNKTPSGGATMEDMQEAYSDISGKVPAKRTIQRIIRRLKGLFDPLAHGETADSFEDEEFEEGCLDEEIGESEIGIKKRHIDNKDYYFFHGNFKTPSIDINEALLSLLSSYPQNRSMLKEAYKNAMQQILGDAMKGISTYIKLISEIDTHVYVAEPVPADAQKHARIIEDVFRAMRDKKCVRLKYISTFDGSFTERIVEPYGLICRFNNWYLTGFCKERKERRVFHLVHIQDLRVLDTSTYKMPKGFSLSEEYSDKWAIRTGGEPAKPQKVRLLVNKGVAARFRALKFHQSQKVINRKNGEAEVIFKLTYPDEIIPWLVGWGNTIKILEPEDLKKKTLETLKNTLKHHRSKQNNKI